MKRSCHPNLTDGKFAKSNPFHFKTTHKRLIFNYFKELLTRFNGTAMIQVVSKQETFSFGAGGALYIIGSVLIIVSKLPGNGFLEVPKE